MSTYNKTYYCWQDMKRRCLNKSFRYFNHYGGRGIRICKRWMIFKNFLEDMGEKPPGMTIDRINNNKSYSKQNCRWASRKEQANNRRTNTFLNYNGESKTRQQWAEFKGLSKGCLADRIKRGWSIERALNTKPQIRLDVLVVTKIKRLLRRKVPVKVIANKFKLSNKIIGTIRCGQNWKHVK